MNQEQLRKKNRKLVGYLIITAVVMFAFGYALVPLYNVMCKQLGLNGKTSDQAVTTVTGDIDRTRTISIEFLATNHANMPWSFFPKVKKFKMHPGEMKRMAYYAKNTQGHTMTVQAIPSVTPGLAAPYLKKTECFCFTQQTLPGGKDMDMPLLFHIDKDLPRDITTVTLAYTLFDVTGMYLKKTGREGRLY